MNRFGEIADELTDLLEELDRPELAGEGRRLKGALQKAFARACEAERTMRQRAEAEAPAAEVAVRAQPVFTAQVIDLAHVWAGGGRERARRSNG